MWPDGHGDHFRIPTVHLGGEQRRATVMLVGNKPKAGRWSVFKDYANESAK